MNNLISGEYCFKQNNKIYQLPLDSELKQDYKVTHILLELNSPIYFTKGDVVNHNYNIITSIL